jgi:hypothetical protein
MFKPSPKMSCSSANDIPEVDPDAEFDPLLRRGVHVGRKRNDVPEAAGVRLDSCFASWSERLGDLETVVVRFGRVSDLVVVPRPPSGSVQGQRC